MQKLPLIPFLIAERRTETNDFNTEYYLLLIA